MTTRWMIISIVASVSIVACSRSSTPTASFDALNDSVPQATCGAGSLPETDIQGRVSLEDRVSGRSAMGYRCNLKLVGQYQGQGASWVNQSYDHCGYMSTHFPSVNLSPGVQVVDASNPAAPMLSTTLTSLAMLGTWESLKINTARGLMAASAAYTPTGNGPFAVDVYDLTTDCARPLLRGTVLLPILGHEGAWSPDGKTYWVSSVLLNKITAVDMTDPTAPTSITEINVGTHGLSISADGKRMYLSEIGASNPLGSAGDSCGNGLAIFDISQIQARVANPKIQELGHLCWDGETTQSTVPVSVRGKPYLIAFDEGGTGEDGTGTGLQGPAGSVRIIDISNEAKPFVVSRIRLEIHMPENSAEAKGDVAGTGAFGYQAHYCAVDRDNNPTALACSFFNSGVRVFDIRNVTHPREIAYFNPPAQVDKALLLSGSEHAANPLIGNLGFNLFSVPTSSSPSVQVPAALTADWCTSPPRFVGKQLWVTCQDNGFMVLEFTNAAYPL